MLAQGALGGAETSSFWNYWNTVKGQISQIYAIGGKLASLNAKLDNIHSRASKVDPNLANEASKQRPAMVTLQDRWEAVRKMIDQYLPTWKKAEADTGAEHPLSTDYTVGALPLILVGGAALAALAYVATSGLSLIKDYEFQKAVLTSLERRLISTEQAKGLIKSSTQVPTFGTAIGGEVGKYIGIAALGLGAIYLLPMLLKKRATARG